MQWWCSAQGTRWTWEWRPYPGVWLLMLLIAVTYYRLTHGASAAHRHQTAAGWCGIVCLWLALDWPLGALAAGYLASAHAVQFLLIAMIAAPLLLVGIRPSAPRTIPTAGMGAALLGVATHPVMAAVFFNVVTITTHVTGVVDTLMVSQWGAFAIDALWLLSALCFWWPTIVPVPVRPRFHTLWQILYLFLGTLFHTAIAMVMLITDLPLYRVYELAPPMTGLSSLEDLHIAGGIMELAGAGIMLGIITWRFFRWANRLERDDRRTLSLPAR